MADESKDPVFREPSLLRDFVYFLAHNKKWWLVPILVLFLVLFLLMLASTTGAAPFLYTLF
jgi:Family of unknown function (DUF5989)